MCIIRFRLGYVKEAMSIIVSNIFIRIEIFLLIELVLDLIQLEALVRSICKRKKIKCILLVLR